MLWWKVAKREHSGPKCTLIQSLYLTDSSFKWTSHTSCLAQLGGSWQCPGPFLALANNIEIERTCGLVNVKVDRCIYPIYKKQTKRQQQKTQTKQLFSGM